jgi:hypothetical protein
MPARPFFDFSQPGNASAGPCAYMEQMRRIGFRRVTLPSSHAADAEVVCFIPLLRLYAIVLAARIIVQ